MAPNGKPANLTEQQWLQVRTPDFKKRFGDWELSSLYRSMRRICGSDQLSLVKNKFMGKPLPNNIDKGVIATVSGESFTKMASESARSVSVSPQAHYQAFGNIDKLFRLAIRDERREGKKSSDEHNISAIHHFIGLMPFDEDVLKVTMLVKEFIYLNMGTSLYFLHALKIDNAGVVGRDPVVSGNLQREENLTSSPPPSVNELFVRMVSDVKGDGASKVVDGNY